MARILYLHGSKAGPFGTKPSFLERQGHELVGRPRLPYPNHPRVSWRWLRAYFSQCWFDQAVGVVQDCLESCRPDVVVGSSMGGAVAMNLPPSDVPQVLIAPAWAAWAFLRFGKARSVKPATVLIHGDNDWLIFRRYSRSLLSRSRVASPDAQQISTLEQGLTAKLNDRALHTVSGRLVLIHGEGHRCNSSAALRALQAGVEELVKFSRP